MLLIYIALAAEAAALIAMFHALFTMAWATGEDLRYKKESFWLNLLFALAIPVIAYASLIG